MDDLERLGGSIGTIFIMVGMVALAAAIGAGTAKLVRPPKPKDSFGEWNLGPSRTVGWIAASVVFIFLIFVMHPVMGALSAISCKGVSNYAQCIAGDDDE